MNSIIKMGLKLLLITSVAALALGITNMLTEGSIANQSEYMAVESRKAVLALADSFEEMPAEKEPNDYPGLVEIHKGISQGEIVGYTFRVLTPGYGGNMEIVIGIGTNDGISAITIVTHEETPGLGAKATDPEFTNQYSGMDAQNQIDYDEISAITGATITSVAVTDGVNIAIEYYANELVDGSEGI